MNTEISAAGLLSSHVAITIVLSRDISVVVSIMSIHGRSDVFTPVHDTYISDVLYVTLFDERSNFILKSILTLYVSSILYIIQFDSGCVVTIHYNLYYTI